MQNQNLILAVDTSISQGSFSLWKNGVEINSLLGNSIVTRSVDIVETVKQLLDEASILKTEITKVLFTNGPGSYTGLRVGVSSMLGFCYALNCPFQTYSVLEVFAIESAIGDKSITIVGTGREEVVYQEFIRNSTMLEKIASPRKVQLDSFIKLMGNKRFDFLIGEAHLLNKIPKDGNYKAKAASDNVSSLIFRLSHSYPNDDTYNILSLNYGDNRPD